MLHLFLAEPFRQIGFPYLITLTLVAIESLLSLLQSFHQGFLRGRFLPFFWRFYEQKIAKLSPSPNPTQLGLSWLYFQIIQPPTHPEKYKTALIQHGLQNKSCFYQ